MIKNKNAQAHVEVMLSFIIFLTAIFLIFLFMNPFAKTQEENPSVDRAVGIIIENMSYTMGKLSIIAINSDCYSFDTSVGDDKYIKTTNTRFVEVLAQNIAGKKEYNIYFSEAFPSDEYIGYDPACSSYKLGNYIEEKYLYYNRIKQLASDLSTEYATFKETRGIVNDFSFSVKSPDGMEIGELSFSKKAPGSVEISSKEFPVRIIDSIGKINEYTLTIKVW